MNSADVVAFLEHLLREVPGRLVIIWDGAPIHRSQVIKEFLANGAAQRLHLERLPAYAPELNPGEGLWATAQRGRAAQPVLLQYPASAARTARRGQAGPAKTTRDSRLLPRGKTLDPYDRVSRIKDCMLQANDKRRVLLFLITES